MTTDEAARAYLRELGASEEEVDDAFARDDVLSLAGDLVRRRGMEAISLAELARRVGVDVSVVERYRRAIGMPMTETVPPLTAGLEGYLVAAALVGDAGAREYVRIISSAAARIAETGSAITLNHVMPQLNAQALALLDKVQFVEAMTTEMLARTTAGFDTVFREHLLINARRARAERESESAHVAIAFVDLTDSTAWSEATAMITVAAALARFDEYAWNAAVEHGARLVKMIGDEAMFVASDAQSAVNTALELCRAVDRDDDLPPARGAVGRGLVYTRSGDYFGSLVNLISRAVKVAQPGSIVATRTVADALDDNYRVGPFTRHEFRGLSEPVDVAPLDPNA